MKAAKSAHEVRYVRTLSPLAERKAQQVRYQLARAAAWDAGNASMRAGGRAQWSVDDWNASCREFDRLLPEPQGERGAR